MMKLIKDNIAALYRSLSIYIYFLTLFFTILIAGLMAYYFYTQVLDIQEKAAYWNNTFNQTLTILDHYSTIQSEAGTQKDIQWFETDISGNIIRSVPTQLVGLNISPSTYFRSTKNLDQNEIHIGIYPDFLSGEQKVFFSKLTHERIMCTIFNPGLLFPRNIKSTELILVVSNSTVIYSNRKEWIGTPIKFNHVLTFNRKLYLASILNIYQMKQSSVILLHDITKNFYASIAILSISLFLTLFMIITLRFISGSFKKLKTEQETFFNVSELFVKDLEYTPHISREYTAFDIMLRKYKKQLGKIESSFSENRILIQLINRFITQSLEFLTQINRQATEKAEIHQEMIKSQTSSLAEKDVLIKEIHHRVKNNLQIIASLLQLQAGTSKTDQIKEYINTTTSRIQAMALVHEQLYSISNNTNFAVISPYTYFKRLSDYIFSSCDTHGNTIHLEINVPEITIQEMVPLGLITNELLTNSIKYARVNGEGMKAALILTIEGNNISYYYRDNGENFDSLEISSFGNSLGHELIQNLVLQLGGILEFIELEGHHYYYFSFSKKTLPNTAH